jgi:hypothetical protein
MPNFLPLTECKLRFYRFETVAYVSNCDKGKQNTLPDCETFIQHKVLFGSVRSITIAYALQQTISSN